MITNNNNRSNPYYLFICVSFLMLMLRFCYRVMVQGYGTLVVTHRTYGSMCVCELVATKDAVIAEKVVLDNYNTNLKARVDELVEAANSSVSQCNADDGKLAFDTCRCGELLAATDSDCSTLNEDISKIIQNNPCGLFRALMAAQVALQDRIVFLEPFIELKEINDQLLAQQVALEDRIVSWNRLSN